MDTYIGFVQLVCKSSSTIVHSYIVTSLECHDREFLHYYNVKLVVQTISSDIFQPLKYNRKCKQIPMVLGYQLMDLDNLYPPVKYKLLFI